jgi:hypothetical protein
MSPHHPLRRALPTAALILTALVSLPALTPALRAAILEHDLQQGLAYLRTSELPADLATIETTLTNRPALVLDLRHAAADDESAASLGRFLSRAPTATRFVRLVLVSRHTDKSLLKQLATPHPGVVLLGAQAADLTLDVSVATTPEDDALAYEALTSGVSLDKLLSGTTPQKARHDEASLVRAHANGNGRSSLADEPENDPANDPATGAIHETSSEEAKAEAPKPPAQPVDRVLLRAVQLHRTLLALKKL